MTSLVGLGFKDHSLAGSGLDGGRDDGAIGSSHGRCCGMYQPDAHRDASRQQSETYLVTANEGDVREYAGLNAAGTEVGRRSRTSRSIRPRFPHGRDAEEPARWHRPAEGHGVQRRHRRRRRLRRAVRVRRAVVLDLVDRRRAGVRQRRRPRADHRRRVSRTTSTPATRTTPVTIAATTRDRSRRA